MKFISKGNIKNCAIVFLVFLSVFQTVKLWVEDSSSRNFFYSFSENNENPNTMQYLSKLVAPYRIATRVGENEFNIKYNDMLVLSSAQKQAGDKVISSLLAKGDFNKSYPIVWSDLLAQKCIVYEYHFSMPTEAFVQHFKQKSGLITNKFSQFDNIIILPGKNKQDSITLIFTDKSTQMAHEYSLNNGDLRELIVTTIDSIAAENNDLYYVFFPEVNSSINNNIFAAQGNVDNFVYKSVYSKNPYGELSLANVEKSVNSFFTNPTSKNPLIRDGVYTFTDDNTVVYYHPNNVLEYSNYKSISTNIRNSFLSSYLLAVSIIEKDSTIENEYYLSGYSLNSSGYSFTFDYTINNFPLILSKELRTLSDLNSIIEISISKESVKYKRYIATFYEESEPSSGAYINFIDAYEAALSDIFGQSSNTSNESEIESFSLGYRIDSGKNLYLNWFIDMDGLKFSKPTQ